jgi:hypothetical protein
MRSTLRRNSLLVVTSKLRLLQCVAGSSRLPYVHTLTSKRLGPVEDDSHANNTRVCVSCCCADNGNAFKLDYSRVSPLLLAKRMFEDVLKPQILCYGELRKSIERVELMFCDDDADYVYAADYTAAIQAAQDALM